LELRKGDALLYLEAFLSGLERDDYFEVILELVNILTAVAVRKKCAEDEITKSVVNDSREYTQTLHNSENLAFPQNEIVL